MEWRWEAINTDFFYLFILGRPICHAWLYMSKPSSLSWGDWDLGNQGVNIRSNPRDKRWSQRIKPRSSSSNLNRDIKRELGWQEPSIRNEQNPNKTDAARGPWTANTCAPQPGVRWAVLPSFFLQSLGCPSHSCHVTPPGVQEMKSAWDWLPGPGRSP